MGLPRESKIWRATILVIALGDARFRYSPWGNEHKSVGAPPRPRSSRPAAAARRPDMRLVWKVRRLPRQAARRGRAAPRVRLAMKLFGSGAFALTVALMTSSMVLEIPWASMYSCRKQRQRYNHAAAAAAGTHVQ